MVRGSPRDAASSAAQAAAGPADRVAPVAFGLALILVAANLCGHAAIRLGQVAVLGDLLAGVVLGNLPGLGVLRLPYDPSIDMIARLGALVLLFDVGLELTAREVFAVGRTAVEAQDIYWCNQTTLTVMRRDKKTGAVTSVGLPHYGIESIALDATNIYSIDTRTYDLVKQAK